MGDMTDDEKWFAYGDENGDGSWNDDEEPPYDFGSCQNCDTVLTPEQARRGVLYCKPVCSQIAATIRYARATLRDGRYERDPEVSRAIDIRIAMALSGGYPTKERTLPSALREEIFTRDKYTCKLCGAVATEIDHIRGSSSDSSNLQALCKPCNMKKAEANFRPATPEEEQQAKRIWERINMEQPLRICDDDETWNDTYRDIIKEQKKWAAMWY